MRIPSLKRPKSAPRSRSPLLPHDILRAELCKEYDIFPQDLPGRLIGALEDAGFAIRSHDYLENEIALAYQAGIDAATEA